MAKIAVSGASGLIGTAVVNALCERGDTVLRLVRRAAVQPDEVGWDPSRAELQLSSLDGVDAIVNFAGAPIGRLWTPRVQREIVDSRIEPTRTLARAAAALGSHVVLINGSAVGLYGDRGRTPLYEDTEPAAGGFVPELVQDWEAATADASDAGNRVALVRTGLVMSPHGGAMAPLLVLLRRGVGGALGPGTQVWPWISLVDEVRGVLWLLDHDLHGPVNFAAPATTTNEELLAAIAGAMGTRLRIGAPAWALRLALGGFADEVLASQNLVPKVLLDSGFEFRHATIEQLADWMATKED